MPLPLLAFALPALIGAAGQGISAFAGSRAARKQRESDEKLTREKLDLERDQLALEESELNPFRDLLAQVATAQAFDRIATPLDFSGSPYASYIPANTGGSAEMRAGAGTARTAALSGQGRTGSALNRSGTPITSGVLDLIVNGRSATPRNGTMPVGQPQPTSPFLADTGAMPLPQPLAPGGAGLDAMPMDERSTREPELMPSYIGLPPATPSTQVRRRRSTSSRRRMPVAA